jgi:thiol-disulfide isomerase/thioredoxin
MKRLSMLRGLALLVLAVCMGCSSPASPVGHGDQTSEVTAPATSSSEQITELRAAADLLPCPGSAGEPGPASDLPFVDLACLGGGPDVPVGELAGTPYVLNFWASWCAECVDEVPYFQQVADTSAGRVAVLGVNYLDLEEPALLAAPEFGLHYPSLFDPDGLLGETFHIPGLPTTYFVDAAGTVVGQKSGAFDSADELREAIQRELGVAL